MVLLFPLWCKSAVHDCGYFNHNPASGLGQIFHRCHSIHVQKILLEKGAITAANLDGGSSSVMVKDHKLINRPSSHYGMRYLPSAFLIFDKPNEVVVDNL
jgi:hypothetical protein